MTESLLVTTPFGRPRGEIRFALAEAAKWYEQQRALQPVLSVAGTLLIGATRMELVERAQVGRRIGRITLDNMVRVGELVHVGSISVAGHPRPLGLYTPATAPAVRSTGADDLTATLAMWRPRERVRAVAVPSPAHPE